MEKEEIKLASLTKFEWALIYRTRSGCSIDFANEMWEGGHPLPSNTYNGQTSLFFRDGLEKVPWVKKYREETGTSLKEAIGAWNKGEHLPSCNQGKVFKPCNQEEAENMIRSGYLWLKNNAPERLGE